jgi:DNA-binding NarL/FixJ family response regulator
MEKKVKSAGGRIRVGLVEDNASLRKIFGDWLRTAQGIEFIKAFPDAESAVGHVGELDCDVILVDINLPGMNGIEFVKRMKPELPQTQFMMVTVYEDTERIFEALASGASGYLLKQTTCDELVAAIREISVGGAPMTTNIARKVVKSFQRQPTTDPAYSLSPRESEILDLLVEGYLYKEIATKLGVSEPTVCTFVRRIYDKLHVRSRSQAIAMRLKQRSG